MSTITHVFVTVPAGREVPVPSSEASAAGGHLLRCKPGKLYVLPWTTYTRKRIAAGDLVLSTKDGKPAKAPKDAAASATTKRDADGAVAADQRSDDEINAAAAKPAGKDR